MKDFHVQDDHDDRGADDHRSVLLQSRLPRQLFRAPLKVLRLAPELVRYVRDDIQLLPAVQDLVDVLPHDGLDLAEVLVQLRLRLGLRVPEIALYPLNQRVVLYVLERPRRLIDLRPPLLDQSSSPSSIKGRHPVTYFLKSVVREQN